MQQNPVGSFSRLSVWILSLALGIAAPLIAQNLSGVISGTVTDSSQAVIPNATVTIVNADTKVTAWHGVTNESGLYRAPDLPVGRYNLTVELQGFQRQTINGINLAVDQRAGIN